MTQDTNTVPTSVLKLSCTLHPQFHPTYNPMRLDNQTVDEFHKRMEDAISSAHRNLGQFGIQLSRLVEQFSALEFSTSTLCDVPFGPYDLLPMWSIAAALRPHVHEIIQLAINLSSPLQELTDLTRSTFNHLVCRPVFPTSPFSTVSSASHTLRSLKSSICYILQQASRRIAAMISLSPLDATSMLDSSSFLSHLEKIHSSWLSQLMVTDDKVCDLSRVIETLFSVVHEVPKISV
ncbi:hypothetical protein EV363DRAFT_1304142, partial [Boletus edulis]